MALFLEMWRKATDAEKKQFAQEQFEELLKMGLSRRCAGTLMRETGPRLAVVAAQWMANLYAAIWRNCDLIRVSQLERYLDRQGTAPVTHEEVIARLNNEIAILQGFSNSCDKDRRSSVELSDDYDKITARIQLPSKDSKECQKIFLGITAALPYYQSSHRVSD